VTRRPRRVRAWNAMRRRPGRVTRADRLVVYVVVGVALVLMLVPVGRGEETWVRIQGANGYQLDLPLNVDETVSVPGPLGRTVVEVKDGHVCVVSSPCPEKICMSMGRISQAGRSLVCVPNKVVVTLEGKAATSPDAVTR
jgi:hypothetical protein